MIMQKFDMEIIEFDAADVIVTSNGSGGEPGISTIENIWLSLDSIENYNNVVGQSNPSKLLLMSDPTQPYHGYNGFSLNIPPLYVGFVDVTVNDDPDTVNQPGYRVVSSDGKGYKEILEWLTAHKTGI